MKKLWSILVDNKDLFPTKWSFCIFVTYMALFTCQGILVTASRLGDNTYPYNTTTVVLLTEVTKLIFATLAYISRYSAKTLIIDSFNNRKVLYYYMIPAFLYCLYNNLAFTNLANFDPTSYFMFMQIRLLMTGFIYQFLFKRKLSFKQWISLLVLTGGCMIQKLNPDVISTNLKTDETEYVFMDGNSLFSSSLVLIMIQVCCSVFAGVYNEYIIKNVAGEDVDIMLQNVFMYLDSILCNLIFLGYKNELGSSFTSQSLSNMLQVFVIAIIFNNSLAGIITSLFLKNLNSIVKAFASALELIFTALLSFLLLGQTLHWNTILAVAVVSYAVVMYAQNPLKTITTNNKINNSYSKDDNSDQKTLLPTKSNVVIMPK